MGHVISKDGITVDLEKIATIMEWPTPKYVEDVRSFKGLTCYYQRFIKGFSKIVHSITTQQRKNMNFIWFKKCEESFQQLKRLLTNAPIPKIVYPEKDFMVCIDVFIEGMGGLLM